MAGDRRWTKEELDILRKQYGVIDSIQLSELLNRSVDAIQWKASSLGIKFRRDDFLLFSEKFDEIINKLNLLDGKLNSLLKIKEKRLKKWTSDEKNYLIENHGKKTISEIAQYINRSIAATDRMVNVLNIERGKNKIKYTDEETKFILDNYKTLRIKDIAEQCNITVSQVNYFFAKYNLKKYGQKGKN